MTKKEEKEIEETFLISSTDEAHHTKDEYAYVDKVALSTNKFYMISLLNPRSNLSELFKSNPRKLSYKQKAFLSYYKHCESHVEIDRTLRCLYILKGIKKVLNEEISYDYIDKIDKCSAHDLELEAYLTQINYKFTPYDLKLSLINYIEKEFGLRVGKIRTKIIGFRPPRYMYEYYRYEYGIVDNKGANAGDNELLKGTSNNSDSFNFFEFLDYTFIPALTEAVRVDKKNLLSQFIFGISSAFMPVPLSPIIYFVDDLEKTENKRIGYCFLRENLEQQYHS